MRVAVCLFGLPRGSVACWDSVLRNLVEPFDSDVFIHNWIPPAHVDTHHGMDYGLRNKVFKLLAYFKQNAKLKAFRVEDQYFYDSNDKVASWGRVTKSNQINAVISMRRAYFLTIDHGGYDYYIFVRSDLLVSSALNSNLLDNTDAFHSGSIVDDFYYKIDGEDLVFGMMTPDRFFERMEDRLQDDYFIENDIYNYMLFSLKESFSRVANPVNYRIDVLIFRSLAMRIKHALVRSGARIGSFLK